MNRNLFGILLLVMCKLSYAEEVPLKDPTAPFNKMQAAPVLGARTANKKSGPRWVLDGVLISEEGKKALINGRWYTERDSINGWQLVQVDTAAVVLKQGGKSHRILLYPSLTNNTLTLKSE